MTPHGTFTIERTFPTPVEKAFAAWTTLDTKARWFMGPPERGWKILRRELDVRVGGHEIMEGAFPDGFVTLYEGRYHVVEPNRRLVTSFDLFLAGELHSVALDTVDFEPTAAGGTRMVFTETTVYIDGEDATAGRREGTALHLDRLSRLLDEVAAG
ncbi:MAG: hypothetical protein JWM80_616 [Cyanobacteria bacterium RYN_339]|nr:hypothetical protein [Cyanobacteria bacterium RYN_339]